MATLLNYSAGRFRQEIADWNSALPLGLPQPSLQQPDLHVFRSNMVELLGRALSAGDFRFERRAFQQLGARNLSLQLPQSFPSLVQL